MENHFLWRATGGGHQGGFFVLPTTEPKKIYKSSMSLDKREEINKRKILKTVYRAWTMGGHPNRQPGTTGDRSVKGAS